MSPTKQRKQSSAKARKNLKRRLKYAANRDMINKARRADHASNPERRNAAKRSAYAANATAVNEARRADHASNPERRNAANRSAYAANNNAINDLRRVIRAAHRSHTREGAYKHTATFSTEKITDNTNFDDHQNNIDTAVMLFHHNSGLTRFNSVEDLESDDETSRSIAREDLLKEISRQKLSSEEKSKLVAKYLKAQGTGGYNGAKYGRNGNSHADAITCASCGVRTLNAGDNAGESKLFSLDEIDTLMMDEDAAQDMDEMLKEENIVEIPTSATGDFIKVNPNNVRSYYKYAEVDGNVRYYHLHREFVDEEATDNAIVTVSI